MYLKLYIYYIYMKQRKLSNIGNLFKKISHQDFFFQKRNNRKEFIQYYRMIIITFLSIAIQ